MPDSKQLRLKRIQTLRQECFIKTQSIEAALLSVKRETHATWLSLEDADADKAFTNPHTEADSTISQPRAVAIMLEAFDLSKGMNILEIGTGTGYNAALMTHLVSESGQVTSIDIEPELIQKAKENLQTYKNTELLSDRVIFSFLKGKL